MDSRSDLGSGKCKLGKGHDGALFLRLHLLDEGQQLGEQVDGA